jgi:hypothetical protein
MSIQTNLKEKKLTNRNQDRKNNISYLSNKKTVLCSFFKTHTLVSNKQVITSVQDFVGKLESTTNKKNSQSHFSKCWGLV